MIVIRLFTECPKSLSDGLFIKKEVNTKTEVNSCYHMHSYEHNTFVIHNQLLF